MSFVSWLSKISFFQTYPPINVFLEEQVRFLFNHFSFLGKFASKKKPATTLQTSPTFDLEFYKYNFATYTL